MFLEMINDLNQNEEVASSISDFQMETFWHLEDKRVALGVTECIISKVIDLLQNLLVDFQLQSTIIARIESSQKPKLTLKEFQKEGFQFLKEFWVFQRHIAKQYFENRLMKGTPFIFFQLLMEYCQQISLIKQSPSLIKEMRMFEEVRKQAVADYQQQLEQWGLQPPDFNQFNHLKEDKDKNQKEIQESVQDRFLQIQKQRRIDRTQRKRGRIIQMEDKEQWGFQHPNFNNVNQIEEQRRIDEFENDYNIQNQLIMPHIQSAMQIEDGPSFFSLGQSLKEYLPQQLDSFIHDKLKWLTQQQKEPETSLQILQQDIINEMLDLLKNPSKQTSFFLQQPYRWDKYLDYACEFITEKNLSTKDLVTKYLHPFEKNTLKCNFGLQLLQKIEWKSSKCGLYQFFSYGQGIRIEINSLKYPLKQINVVNAKRRKKGEEKRERREERR